MRRVYTLLKYLPDDSVTVVNVKKLGIKNSESGRDKKIRGLRSILVVGETIRSHASLRFEKKKKKKKRRNEKYVTLFLGRI